MKARRWCPWCKTYGRWFPTTEATVWRQVQGKLAEHQRKCPAAVERAKEGDPNTRRT